MTNHYLVLLNYLFVKFKTYFKLTKINKIKLSWHSYSFLHFIPFFPPQYLKMYCIHLKLFRH